jgi:hypothetical protein
MDIVVRCAECGLESKLGIKAGTVESAAIPQEEMTQRCKLAAQPNFDFFCPHLDEAISQAMLS